MQLPRGKLQPDVRATGVSASRNVHYWHTSFASSCEVSPFRASLAPAEEWKTYFTKGEQQKGLKYLSKQNKGPEDTQLLSLNTKEENELFHPGHVISNTNIETNAYELAKINTGWILKKGFTPSGKQESKTPFY